MEQGRREEAMKQQQQDHHHHHHWRLKQPEQQENQPQQPQKCPRCDSLNTKFCYYNNYSLSQPRYICKTCRRYWTQGGTLRNVPVGGGCRKGKRSKAASSSGGENSRSHQPPPPQPPHELQMPQNLSTSASRNKELGNLAANPMNSYYSGDGFLSSLPNQPLNLGGSSNMALLQGFNMPSFSSQQAQNQQIQQQNEFYQMGNRDQSLIQPNRPFGSWNIESHIKNSTDISNPTASDPNFWTNGGNFLNPNPWPDLPGYGHPP